MKPFDLLDSPLHDGICLIEASAGTGKTYTIAGLVLRLVVERDVPIGRILVVTFTNAATDELKTRIRASLEKAWRTCRSEVAEPEALHVRLFERYGAEAEQRLLRALRAFDDVPIATIHGFCQRVLDRNAFESANPFVQELLQDDQPLQQRVAHDFWRSVTYDAEPLLADWIAGRTQCSVEQFLADWRRARQAPRTRLHPKPLALEDAARRARAAAVAFADAWDEHGAALAALRWNQRKNRPRTETVPEWFAGVDAFVAAVRTGRSRFVDAAAAVADAHAFVRKRPKQPIEPCEPCIAAARELRDAMHAYEHALRGAFFETLDRELDRVKRSEGVLFYDDLLRRLHRALCAGDAKATELIGALQREYAAVLIDEFQDTDRTQWEIFERCFRGRPFFLIGDPKQAIYGFRGGDVYTYLRAARSADFRYTLTTNWRSQPGLLAAVNLLYAQTARPFVVEDIGYHAVDPAPNARATLAGDDRGALHWILARRGDKDAADPVLDALVAECVHLFTNVTNDQHSVTPDDVAVLVRTNRQAQEIQATLRAAGIPSVIGKGGEIFASEEMSELERIVAAIAQPRNEGLARAAWTTLALGLDAEGLRGLIADDEALERELTLLESCRATWLEEGLYAAVERLLTHWDVRRRLLELEGGERRLANLLHALEILHAEAETRGLSPDGLLLWLADLRSGENDIEAERRELRLESDAPAVQILTMHRSKGLEFDVVFCTHLWDSRAVNRKAPVLYREDGERSVLHCAPDDDAVQRAEVDRCAEDARVAYVALTRAKQRCYVLWREGKSAAKSAVPLLLADPPEPTEGSGAWLARAADEYPETFEQRLAALAARSGGTLTVAEHEASNAPRSWLRPAPDGPDPERRRFHRRPEQLLPWRTESFTSLTTDADVVAAAAPERADRPREDGEPQESSRGLLAFATGRTTGFCLHEILEHTDFQAPLDAAVRERIQRTIERYDLLEPSRHRAAIDPVDAVVRSLNALIAHDLPAAFGETPDGRPWRLADVPPDERLDEWQFHLPLLRSDSPDLARVFERSPDALARAYAPHLAALGRRATAATLAGYLTGWVDHVARFGERYWVFDWKSNWLGDRPRDYAEPALREVMFEHHYVLQYHLYLTALHRHLRARLRDYDPERHLGGACYVFLRGVGRERGGFFAHRPPAPSIAALDRWIGTSRDAVEVTR